MFCQDADTHEQASGYRRALQTRGARVAVLFRGNPPPGAPAAAQPAAANSASHHAAHARRRHDYLLAALEALRARGKVASAAAAEHLAGMSAAVEAERAVAQARKRRLDRDEARRWPRLGALSCTVQVCLLLVQLQARRQSAAGHSIFSCVLSATSHGNGRQRSSLLPDGVA